MRLNFPPVIKNLLIINIIFFMIQALLPIGEEFTKLLALNYWGSEGFYPYQFVTYMFLHGGSMHLFFNMFALYMFGSSLEYEIGSKRFLIFYLITGIGAGLLHMCVLELEFMGIKSAVNQFLANPTPDGFSILASSKLTRIDLNAVSSFIDTWYKSPDNSYYITYAKELAIMAQKAQFNILTTGASGSIFGLLLAFGLMHPNDRVMLMIPPIPMKAKYFVIGYGAIELILGFTDTWSSIAHFAHLGGMLWGWLLLSYWKKKGYIYY